MKLLFGQILLVLSIFCFTQNGEQIYSFMNVPTSARQASLGGNINSAWDSDSNLALWNPALMNEEMNNQVGINYISYLADISFGTVSWVHQLDDKNYISLHGRYFDYGTFTQTNEFGNEEGTFTASDVAITLGYAYNISDFFTVGTNLSYINSKIESYQSTGLVTDLGIVFHDIDYNTNVSLVIRNLGWQLTAYDSKLEKLPLQINLGFSQKYEEFPIEISANLHDLQKFDISSPSNKNGQEVKLTRKLIDHFSFGAELFPDKGFNLRVGYNFKRGNELAVQDVRSFSGLTFGFGVKIKSFKFDYARANYFKGDASNHFGMRIDLESLLGKRYSWQ